MKFDFVAWNRNIFACHLNIFTLKFDNFLRRFTQFWTTILNSREMADRFVAELIEEISYAQLFDTLKPLEWSPAFSIWLLFTNKLDFRM